MKLLINSAKCLLCEDVIFSRSVHDFQSCKCGNISVDGGREYDRRLYKSDSWQDLCIEDDGDHQTRRKHLTWGSWGKSGKGPFQLIKIMHLTDDHLTAIIRTQDLKGLYKEVMHEEALYRISTTGCN